MDKKQTQAAEVIQRLIDERDWIIARLLFDYMKNAPATAARSVEYRNSFVFMGTRYGMHRITAMLDTLRVEREEHDRSALEREAKLLLQKNREWEEYQKSLHCARIRTEARAMAREAGYEYD